MELSEITTVDARPFQAAAIHLRIPRDRIEQEMEPAIMEIIAALEAQGLQPAGPMFAEHLALSDTHFDFEVGFPVDSSVRSSGRVRCIEVPGMKAATATMRGPYEELYEAWQAFGDAVRDNFGASAMAAPERVREVYRLGPESTPDPACWETDLMVPVPGS